MGKYFYRGSLSAQPVEHQMIKAWIPCLTKGYGWIGRH